MTDAATVANTFCLSPLFVTARSSIRPKRLLQSPNTRLYVDIPSNLSYTIAFFILPLGPSLKKKYRLPTTSNSYLSKCITPSLIDKKKGHLLQVALIYQGHYPPIISPYGLS